MNTAVPSPDLEHAAAPRNRRRADRRPGPPPEADRLVTMLVLAALFHGLVILGVRFHADLGRAPEGIGMEVLLVSDELPESRENPDARYLAQRTQEGSGNTDERVAARLPGSPVPEAPAAAPTAPGAEATDRSLASSRGAGHTEYHAEALPPGAFETPVEQPGPRAPPRSEAEADLLLRGARRDELYVSPDTRASEVAPYLAAWKQRVERIGTLNYPSVAQRQGLSGNPVIEVVIGADGQLRSATVRRTSGQPAIDAAALDILRLASPFEPFPAELAARHDQLRFAYEWQFDSGRMRGSVTVP